MISSDYNKRKPLFRIAVGAIIAILLFGIGTTGVISGTNATADAFSGTALANAGFFINVSFSTINSTIGNWSVNVTNPLNNSGYQLDSGWINLNINSTGAPQYVVGVNNSIIGNGFSSVNGTIYISLDTSNITDPNTFDVTFTNLDNMSENVTVAGLKFVAGNLGMVNISELSATTTVGSNATYILNLTNNGTATDTYTITVDNPNGASFGLNITSPLTLAAGATQIFSLNVTDTIAGTVYLNVTATSSDPAKFSYVNTTTTVTANTIDVTLSNAIIDFSTVTSGSINQPSILPLNVTIQNTTNVNVNLTINGTTFQSGIYSFGVENLNYSNSSAGTQISMSTSFPPPPFADWINIQMLVRTDRSIYFWLNIPPGQPPGAYNSTIYVRVEEYS